MCCLCFYQEEFYGVPVTLADRYMVESEAEKIYERALNEDVAFLVVGDPLWYAHNSYFIL